MSNPQRVTCGAEYCRKKQAAKVELAAYHRRRAGGERRLCRRESCNREIIRTPPQMAWPAYCSDWCKRISAADRREERSRRRRAAAPQRVCQQCARPLPAHAPRYRKYCNAVCGERFRKGIAEPLQDRACAKCSQPLPAGARSYQVYCSLSCKRAVGYAKRAEYVRAKSAEWRRKNPERYRQWHAEYRAAHRETLRGRMKRDYALNPLPWKNARDRRRVALAGDPRTRSVSLSAWNRLVARHGGRCFYCGQATEMTMDHVVPLSRGGRHAIGNIVPACQPCNGRKNSRFIMEWRMGKGAKRRAKRAQGA